MQEKICQECRSIIINIDTLEIISHPYHKFFNYTDEKAHNIDWDSAKAYEKLDGSIMILYYYKGEWNVSTSGMPDADGQISDLTDKTFANIFWELWHKLGYQMPNPLTISYTYMFEMISRYNKIVCEYDTENIVLHGIRNNFGHEIDVNNFMFDNPLNWNIVKQYDLSNKEKIIEFVNSRPAIQNEGVVVCDKNFDRIKIKSEEYFNLHYIKSNINSKKCLVDLCRKNQTMSVIVNFPEYYELITDIEERLNNLQDCINETYERLKDIEIQKDFALEACQYKFKALLFEMRKYKINNCSVLIQEMKIDNLIQLIGMKE